MNMTITHHSPWEPLFSTSFAKSVLLGAGFAAATMAVYLITATEPDLKPGGLWMIRPLLVIALSGAIGGAFWYFMLRGAKRRGWRRFLRLILGLFLYIIALWLGTVLGLSGTYWD